MISESFVGCPTYGHVGFVANVKVGANWCLLAPQDYGFLPAANGMFRSKEEAQQAIDRAKGEARPLADPH